MALITINIEDVLLDAGIEDAPELAEPEYDVHVVIDVFPCACGTSDTDTSHDAEELAEMALFDYYRQDGPLLDEDDLKSFLFHARAHAEMALAEACRLAIACKE